MFLFPPDPDHERLFETGSSFRPNHYALYSPLSVVKSVRTGFIENFWNQTETFEALRKYITWNFDGLMEDVAILMNGGRIKTDITGYQNDMTSFETRDDILTMLIHLGYLGYDIINKEVYIPNQEVLQVFKTSTKSREWSITFHSLNNSKKLLEATWAGDEETVDESAKTAISQIHRQKYPDRLEHYKGNLILVGINYDKTVTNENPSFKHHSCLIERA